MDKAMHAKPHRQKTSTTHEENQHEQLKQLCAHIVNPTLYTPLYTCPLRADREVNVRGENYASGVIAREWCLVQPLLPGLFSDVVICG